MHQSPTIDNEVLILSQRINDLMGADQKHVNIESVVRIADIRHYRRVKIIRSLQHIGSNAFSSEEACVALISRALATGASEFTLNGFLHHGQDRMYYLCNTQVGELVLHGGIDFVHKIERKDAVCSRADILEELGLFGSIGIESKRILVSASELAGALTGNAKARADIEILSCRGVPSRRLDEAIDKVAEISFLEKGCSEPFLLDPLINLLVRAEECGDGDNVFVAETSLNGEIGQMVMSLNFREAVFVTRTHGNLRLLPTA